MNGLLNKMNIDLENRKRGLETYPFEKQYDLAKAYPKLVTEHAECFYLSTDYYPEGKFDIENISNLNMIIRQHMENHQANLDAEPISVEPNVVEPNVVEQPLQKTL